MSWARPSLPLRNLDPALSFDFALSFNSRRNCIRSWFYCDNFKHCAITFTSVRN